MSKYFLGFIALLVFKISFSQNTDDATTTKIQNALNNYFDLEREAIHLHIDKTTFITNENIWYQGYIINRKTNKPFFTTNVFIMLYDEAGKLISEKLIYASNGCFVGNIELSSEFHSGIYYIQAYTNWMNNFSENESSLSKITIINPEEGLKNYTKVNENSLEIFINPEGGTIVKDIVNTIGIKVSDCRGNVIENLEVDILNSINEVIKTVKTSSFGLAKFDIMPNDNATKVRFIYNGKTIEKSLPQSTESGVSLNVNNFSIPDKTIINIKTNISTFNFLQNKKIYLLIHQDEKSIIQQINFNSNNLDVIVPVLKSDLNRGVNTIRIIDSDLNEYATRLIYIYPDIEKKIFLEKGYMKEGKNIYSGTSPFKNAIISASVLPSNTKSNYESNNIYSGITINPFLVKNLQNCSYYFKNPERKQFYDLDLELLNQNQLKYNWNLIRLNKSITPNHSFDIGLSLKGNVDSYLKNKETLKAKVVSKKELILSVSDVNEKGEYKNEHLLIGDSTYVTMTLHKMPNFETLTSKLMPVTIGRKRTLNFPIKSLLPQICDYHLDLIDTNTFQLPSFVGKVIQLENINIENKNKYKLKYENQFGNGMLRGYKVDDVLVRQNLFNFIEQNGFDVRRDMGTVTGIYARGRNSLNAAQSTPAIFIDGRAIMSITEIEMLTMDEIDEIYIDSHAIVASMNNNMGIIKIYRKNNFTSQKYINKNENSFYIKDGFARYYGFKNSMYKNSQNTGFTYFGLLDWCARIRSDDDGNFTFAADNFNLENGKTIIEGITVDGELINQEIPLNFN